MSDVNLEKIVNLCKRRGFVWPGSDLYGGMANTYDFGPLGNILKENVKKLWEKKFVNSRTDIFYIDSSILIRPEVWEASGHTKSFADVMVEDIVNHRRYRADHLIEAKLDKLFEGNHKEKTLDQLYSNLSDLTQDQKDSLTRAKVDGFPPELLDKINILLDVKSPDGNKLSQARRFNQLFETKVGIIAGEKNSAYLRGEIAQGLFLNFKNIKDVFHPRLPFGIAQAGKAFRNEITPGQFTHRTLEFDLMEFEYFFDPEIDKWNDLYDYWKNEVYDFALSLGINKDNLRWRAHEPFELAFYSTKTEDLEYKYPWGFKEMFAVAYRTDYDLKNHQEHTGKDLSYIDESNKKFIPHVIEPTFGLSRAITVLLMDAYNEDNINGENRVFLKLSPKVAPVKVAVFALQKDEQLIALTKEVFADLKNGIEGWVQYDESGSIGKRYRRQDEIGTPYCVTVDFESLEDKKVTVRDRDTLKQERVAINDVANYIKEKLS